MDDFPPPSATSSMKSLSKPAFPALRAAIATLVRHSDSLVNLFMKQLAGSMLCLLPAVVMVADETNAIQRVLLDDRSVYTVAVSTNRVTTISFPSPLSAIDAAGVTTDPKVSGRFQLAYTRGSCFFSVRALAPKGSANLNVRWNKRTYVFELVESDKPVLSLILEDGSTKVGVEPALELSPTRLLALLDKAKAFP